MTALDCDVDDCELEAPERRFTGEQLAAIERRDGELLLDAGAGSGKTSVLVERFAQAVLKDGVAVTAILTITFTEKAAAELRERIRGRLRELGADEHARETENAFISTIHGFCARVLRAHALAAGIDPEFTVLDQPESERIADAAFDEALEAVAAQRGAAMIELLASYGAGVLRGAVLSIHGELRSRGELAPRLPALPPAPELEPARAALHRAADAVLAELSAIAEPGARVVQALQRLGRCGELAGVEGEPWPGQLDLLALPGGNGAALSTEACAAYTEALAAFRRACEHAHARRLHELLDALLEAFTAAYERRKREASGLDFEDLELLARELLRREGELRDRYRARFAHVMVDELQDTNHVQMELIELVADGNLFAVGDAQQSIYAFRHADVELFERLGERLAQVGARAQLTTNFRSRPEILEVINGAFAGLFGERFMALRPGRDDPPADDARVEVIAVDKGADWESDGLGSPWRVAESRVLAAHVAELIAAGDAAPREIVLLTRATTDLRLYEHALEERAIPTYVIGGRGYWAHPQVLDVVAYLRALANPRDEEALHTVLASPLLGISIDALVMLAAASRSLGRDPWWLVREPVDGALDGLADADRALLDGFAPWFDAERRAAARASVEELIDRALSRSGYDLTMLAMPGGRRRLANVRKLMRLAREHEAAGGHDLRSFLQLVRGRAEGWAGFGDERESEAPVEGEALDAVRLMTIHRAKGLEFPVVCVADTGRMPWRRVELVRIGRDGRFGVRLSAPGTGKAVPALDYRALGVQQIEAEDREERRLFYVAVTRARERLIVSGAAKLETWGTERAERSPMGWLGPAFEAAGVQPRLVQPEDVVRLTQHMVNSDGPRQVEAAAVPPLAPPPAAPAPAVTRLSYSALQDYQRCGYRFYAERVLGLSPLDAAFQDQPGGPAPEAFTDAGDGGQAGDDGDAGHAQGSRPVLPGTERGLIAHALLERLDFRRPLTPTAAAVNAAAGRDAPGATPLAATEAEEIAALVAQFAGSELCARLARASAVRREERFTFALGAPRATSALGGEVLITGALDVIAREPGGRMLVVDYKSDRLEGRDHHALVRGRYATQQLLYALAALRAGAEAVEVAHVFLERPADPVIARFTSADAPALEQRLAALSAGVLERRFAVTETPHRAVCHGCPAEGGLCSWSTEMTRREAPDTLF